jgi:hypothetical protein
MMKTPQQYMIVSADDPETFNGLALDALANGWLPQGGLTAIPMWTQSGQRSWEIAQAFVHFDAPKKEERKRGRYCSSPVSAMKQWATLKSARKRAVCVPKLERTTARSASSASLAPLQRQCESQ